MLEGYVINECGTTKHIFKRNIFPGEKVSLREIYKTYKNRYKQPYDARFLDWFSENKMSRAPDGISLVVEKADIVDTTPTPENTETELDTSVEGMVQVVVEEVVESKPTNTGVKKKIIPNKLTAAEISELKMSDKPHKVIQQVSSIHKLRRALTLCKGKSGKATLINFIKRRIRDLS